MDEPLAPGAAPPAASLPPGPVPAGSHPASSGTFARESVFLDARQPGKATVVLRLKRAGQISGSSVAAIANLVASAVEGLSPDAVSIIDGNGRLLNRPHAAETGEARTAAADLGYRQGLEGDMLQRINASLEPLLGAGKFRAGVSIDCDFTATEESEDVYDTTKSAVLTSQTTDESTGGLSTAGAPGTQANLPRPPATRAGGPGSGLIRRTENVSYQPGHVVRHTVAPRGSVRKVFASVLVDQTVRWEGSGAKMSRVLVPPSPEVLKGVRDIVASIAGYDEKRGDQLTIETLPFETTLTIEAPTATPKTVTSPRSLEWKNAPVIGGAAVLVFLAAAGFFILRGRRAKIVAAGSATGAIAGTRDPESQPALPAVKSEDGLSPAGARPARSGVGMATSHVAVPTATSTAEELASNIRHQVEKDPTVAAHIIRAWIRDGMQEYR
jgi:flagellar M-ring protein FliF